MFRFEHFEYLWALTLLVPITGLYLYYLWWRKNSLKKFGRTELVQQLTPSLARWANPVKFVLVALAYVFIVLGFANPQIGTKQEKVKRQGIDVVVALDVSNSMLSEDVKPNRLLRAKNFISNFLNELHNDRMGLVVFAGKAYLQMPLTVDYGAAKMYLKTINTNMVPTQGTNIGEAIDLARQSLQSDEQDNKSKALIIITDGEDNEGGVDDALEEAKKEGIKVFTLGVGTDNGAPIPVGNDYKRDESGNIVLTKMNEQMLRDIATKGNGKYLRLGSGKDEVNAILKELGRISTKQFEELVFTDFDDQFQWMLGIALVLLLIEWWISERKSSSWFSKLFANEKSTAV